MSMDLLFPFLDEIFQALATIGDRRLASQAESECGENCTLATSIFANDEIDERAQVDVKVVVTHEVVAFHAFEDSMFGGHVRFVNQAGIFFLDDLSLTQFQLILIINKCIISHR